MKAKIWVLCTVLVDENAPALPAVFASETEACTKYDEVIRAEWDNLMDAEDGPYPGDPDEAQNRIRQAHGCRNFDLVACQLPAAPFGGAR